VIKNLWKSLFESQNKNNCGRKTAMSLIITRNFSNLEKELESAKTDLRDLNENIKRIYGKQDNFGYFVRRFPYECKI
jgi:hypothetical protein